ncbi:MAG: HutD family protein, partial [Lysobacter sp.]|nr:HutD family protein [Lysobacter sp.]
WLWRLSIAEVEQEAVFSAFPGIERELILLRGNGMRLRFDDGETVLLDPPHGRHRFSGERPLRGEPVDGPTHDFNVMWCRDRIDAAVWHRPLVGSMVLFVEPGEHWAIHVLAGQAEAASAAHGSSAAAADTLLLRADATRSRFVLEGGGEALVIRFRARDA